MKGFDKAAALDNIRVMIDESPRGSIDEKKDDTKQGNHVRISDNPDLPYQRNNNHHNKKKPNLKSSSQFNEGHTNLAFRGGNTSNHYVVEIRVVFYKIGEIDTVNEKFFAEAFIEAAWNDPNLDPNEHYDPKKHWNPEISIVNGNGDLVEQKWYHQFPVGMEKKKGSMEESVMNQREQETSFEGYGDSGTMVYERRKVNGSFWQVLDLRNFPSDVQNLTLTLSSSKHISEISLIHSKEKLSSVNVNCFMDHQEWHLYRHIDINESVRESVFSNESFPCLELTLCAARRPAFYYWNAFFLIFLTTISSLTIFSVKCFLVQNRIQTGYTLLLTLLTFKWITNKCIPTISYMTTLDKYSVISIAILSMQCFYFSILYAFMPSDNCIGIYYFIDQIAFYVSCGTYIIFNGYFIILAIIHGYHKRRYLRKREKDYTDSLIGKRASRLKSIMYGI